MKISQMISLLQDMQRFHGDLEVYVKDHSDDAEPDIYAGFVSQHSGEVYSLYDFTHFEEDYPEKEQFDLEKDKLCII